MDSVWERTEVEIAREGRGGRDRDRDEGEINEDRYKNRVNRGREGFRGGGGRGDRRADSMYRVGFIVHTLAIGGHVRF